MRNMSAKPAWYGCKEVDCDVWMRYADEQLGFPYYAEEQDWGLSNTDGARIAEFLDFFDDHPLFPPSYKELVAELIVASLDNGLLLGLVPASLDLRIKDFMRKYWHEEFLAKNIVFFMELADCPPENPNMVGRWLRRLMAAEPEAFPWPPRS